MRCAAEAKDVDERDSYSPCTIRVQTSGKPIGCFASFHARFGLMRIQPEASCPRLVSWPRQGSEMTLKAGAPGYRSRCGIFGGWFVSILLAHIAFSGSLWPRRRGKCFRLWSLAFGFVQFDRQISRGWNSKPSEVVASDYAELFIFRGRPFRRIMSENLLSRILLR